MAEQKLNGRYIVDRLIGRGGMGEVFAGRAVGMDGFWRPVAIKRLHAQHSDELRPLLVAEACLTAKLLHGNIVAVQDLDQDEAGQMFLVMELVDGIDLASLLRTGALPLPVALFVACEILRGLDKAHERGLVHRDVSPQNALIGWDGAVKVSDFGLAKAHATMKASASFVVKGKIAYMSPEQANGAALDGRSDLFSVGVMLWEMICGTRLFGHSVRFEPVPRPRSRSPGLPRNIERITMRLLERDPSHRYPTAGAAIEALAACAAYPRNGRELLSVLLSERRAGDARLQIPSLSDEETASAPTISPLLVPAEPYPDPPRLGRARRAVLVALLMAATALVTMLAVGAVPRIDDHRDPDVPRSRVSPPVEPPANPQRPSEMRPIPVTGAPVTGAPVTGAPLPSSAIPAVSIAPAPALAPRDRPTSAPVSGSARGRQALPAPSPGSTGIRYIDLRELAPPTSARGE